MTAQRYYPALDGLRGVAAICVVLMHRNIWFGLRGWLVHGYLAVDFFFMLSGFVIASAYEQKLRDGLPRMAFVRARLIRLYPLLILGAALGAAWQLCALFAHLGATPAQETGRLWWRALLLAPSLTANPVGSGVFPLNPPTWSLFFELAVNLVYVGLRPWLTTARLAGLVLVSLAALAGLALRHAGVDAGGTREVFWGGFARVSFPFFAGVLIHRLRDAPALARLSCPFWVQAVLLIAVFNLPSAGRAGAAVDLACVGLVFPLALIAGLSAAATQPALGRMRWLGEISYPLYVLHYPLYVILGGLGYGLGVLSPHTMFAYGLACLALILGTSQAALAVYDRPLRSWLQGRGGRRPAASLGAPIPPPSPSRSAGP